jgi:hypothetical protein
MEAEKQWLPCPECETNVRTNGNCPRCGCVLAEACKFCGDVIPVEEWPDHEKGRDVARLACPHQDLEEIAAAEEPANWWERVW